MPDNSASKILPDVIQQYVDDAPFLWLLRNGAVSEPHYNLADLAALDERLEAHIDGLRISGEAGWKLCEEGLSWEEAGEVFVAAVLAFESGDPAKIDRVLNAGISDAALTDGLVSALGWLEFQAAAPHIKRLLSSPAPSLRRVGIAAATVHRKNPGPAIVAAIAGGEPLLKARALRAAGELGLAGSYLTETRKHLADPVALCSFSAAWSAALLSADPAALGTLRTIAESDAPFAADALQLVARRMPQAEAKAWHARLARDPGKVRLAVMAAGAAGEPALVPWLVSQMAVPELSRAAGEAVTMITGADFTSLGLEGEAPEGFESGPSENPEDEDVAMDMDENLPWPNPESIARWWSDHAAGFPAGTRHLAGHIISADRMRGVLRTGTQRQRAAAALELAALEPGTPMFNVKAPGSRQRRDLGISR